MNYIEMTWATAIVLIVSSICAVLVETLRNGSLTLPWAVGEKLRALIAGVLTALNTGLGWALAGDAPVGKAIGVAFVLSTPILVVYLIGAWNEWAAARKVAKVGLLLLLIPLSFSAQACSLFRPHVESPCAGMICASVITVPAGELLVCAKSQLELDNKVATLRARGIVK